MTFFTLISFDTGIIVDLRGISIQGKCHITNINSNKVENFADLKLKFRTRLSSLSLVCMRELFVQSWGEKTNETVKGL